MTELAAYLLRVLDRSFMYFEFHTLELDKLFFQYTTTPSNTYVYHMQYISHKSRAIATPSAEIYLPKTLELTSQPTMHKQH